MAYGYPPETAEGFMASRRRLYGFVQNCFDSNQLPVTHWRSAACGRALCARGGGGRRAPSGRSFGGGGHGACRVTPPNEAAGGRLGSQIQEIARGNAAQFFVRGCDTAKPTNRDNQRNDTNLRNHVLGGQSPIAHICIVHRGISVQANPLDSSVFQFWA